MASNMIKGLTVEIGGDTTKLGQALAGAESQSRSLSTELNQINRLLKVDPTNTDLLAQKQKALAEAIETTSGKLATLKEAEAQVQAQFERGEVSEEQVRALQREIIATEQRLQGYQTAAEDAETATANYGDETEEAEKKSSKFAETLKGALVAGLKAVGAAALAAAAAAGKAALELGQQVVNSYADYEQLVGGVETLFKESAGTVQAYADAAYKTAGLSANQYMETVTGFSASLIQSLDGDTAKAAEYANQAILDMSDNANKMGTDMTSIQNAYQGFAKQNYTMLDNLKLGYGGTKEEMQRLLEDAGKIAGVKFDISSYSDVIQAIHVMQESMGIAGTTALEAEKTISGSIATTKSAYANLITGLGQDNANIAQLVSNLVDSAVNVLNNITPVVQNIVKQVPAALQQVTQAVVNLLPGLINTAVELFNQLLQAIVGMIPQILPIVIQGISQIVNCVVQALPSLIDAVLTILPQLITALAQIAANVIQTIASQMPQIINSIVDFLTNNVDVILDAAMTLLMAIVDAIPQIASALLQATPQIITAIINVLSRLPGMIWEVFTAVLGRVGEFISQMLGKGGELGKNFISTVVNFFTQLPGKIWSTFTTVLSKVGSFISQMLGKAGELGSNFISTVVNFFTQLPGKIWNTLTNVLSKVGEFVGNMVSKAGELGLNFITTVINFFSQLPGKIWDAITGAVQSVITWGSEMVTAGLNAAKNLVTTIVNTVTSLPGKMLDIGRNIVEGIWQGISGAFTWIKNKITGWVGDVLGFIKGLFGIHSPSTETAWMGEMLDKGLAGGLLDNVKSPMSAAKTMAQKTMESAEDGLDGMNLQSNLRARTNSLYNEAAAAGQQSLSSKLDLILAAIKDGQIITLDSNALVGGTAKKYDASLGQTRLLAARGAV